MLVTAVLTPDEVGFVAFNPETGTTTQGDTVEEALENLREAVELYLEDQPLTRTGPLIVTSIDVRENA